MEGIRKIDLAEVVGMECSPFSTRVEDGHLRVKSALKNYLICSSGAVWEDLVLHLLSVLGVQVRMHDFMSVFVLDKGIKVSLPRVLDPEECSPMPEGREEMRKKHRHDHSFFNSYL